MKQSLYPALTCALLLLLGACAEEPLGPTAPTPQVSYQSGTGEAFNEHDFVWSRAQGSGSIDGVVAYRAGQTRYSCSGRDVILTPDTPWVRRRMYILYGSAAGAAIPAEIVRARTPTTSAGDYASYARKTTCDSANHFSFSGLPDGGWYVLTLARPDDGSSGSMAIMRRVETRGRVRQVTLY